MRLIKIALISIVVALIASSCTIKQTIDYNENMSGTQTMSVDMSDLINQLAMFQEEGADPLFNQEDFKSAFDGIENDIAGKGISNFNSFYNDKAQTFGFSFNFEDTKSLNAMYNQEGENAGSKKKSKAANTYSVKKKSLNINYEHYDLKSLLGDEDMGEMESMAGMFGMFTIETEINFPFEIKSVSNSNYKLSADRKTISSSFTFEDLKDNPKNANTKITW